MPRAARALLTLAAWLAPSLASAHTLLVDPTPISPNDNDKSGPCGCFFGADPEDPTEDVTPTACPAQYTVTTFERGSTITVKWKETVNHTGAFRVAFTSKAPDAAKKADLDAGVLYDEPDVNDTAGQTISATVTLPDVTCDECVIQVRQFMQPTNDYYYTCAAVKLVDPPGSGGAGGQGAGGAASSGGAGGAASGGAGGAGPSTGSGSSEVDPSTGAGPAQEPIKIKSGCHVGGESGAAAGVALALALIAGRGRRPRRPSRTER